jgi:hypothetical protein
MELWAVARYDFGLSWKEFEELTPKMFQALGKRRVVAQRYERYAHALTASAVYNTSRTKEDQPMLEAFDFVMTDEQAEKTERLKKARRFIRKVIGSMPIMTPMEKLVEKRLKVIEDLKADGYDNAEQLFDEAWPHLKPKES